VSQSESERKFKISLWVEGQVTSYEEKSLIQNSLSSFLEALTIKLEGSQPKQNHLLTTSEELNYQSGKTRLKYTYEITPDFDSLLAEKAKKKASHQP